MQYSSAHHSFLQVTDHLLLRKGGTENVMVFPENDYDDSGSFTYSDGKYTFTHRAFGADKFRYSWNFGKNWTLWNNWENVTTIEADIFQNIENWWDGDHIVVQCRCKLPLVIFTCLWLQTGAPQLRQLPA
jgi:alpha-1,3-glucan synthase